MSSSPSYASSLAFLLSQVGARSAQLFGERLARKGISARAFGVLSNLDAGRTQTQQQLSDALGIHRNNMVGLIDEMEAAGWVARHRSMVDRRAFDVRLTDAGAALVKAVAHDIPDLDDLISRTLTIEQRNVLTALLLQIAQGLELKAGIHPHLSSTPR